MCDLLKCCLFLHHELNSQDESFPKQQKLLHLILWLTIGHSWNNERPTLHQKKTQDVRCKVQHRGVSSVVQKRTRTLFTSWTSSLNESHLWKDYGFETWRWRSLLPHSVQRWTNPKYAAAILLTSWRLHRSDQVDCSKCSAVNHEASLFIASNNLLKPNL